MRQTRTRPELSPERKDRTSAPDREKEIPAYYKG